MMFKTNVKFNIQIQNKCEMRSSLPQFYRKRQEYGEECWDNINWWAADVGGWWPILRHLQDIYFHEGRKSTKWWTHMFNYARFDVLTLVLLNIKVLLYVTPSRLASNCQRFVERAASIDRKIWTTREYLAKFLYLPNRRMARKIFRSDHCHFFSPVSLRDCPKTTTEFLADIVFSWEFCRQSVCFFVELRVL